MCHSKILLGFGLQKETNTEETTCMHNLMITNSWQHFTGLNKCRMIGEKNIQNMVTSSRDTGCLKKPIVFD